jgi:hypothetical protein
MPGGLVAVNRADHQHAHRRVGVADALDLEGGLGRGGRRERENEEDRGEQGAHVTASC